MPPAQLDRLLGMSVMLSAFSKEERDQTQQANDIPNNDSSCLLVTAGESGPKWELEGGSGVCAAAMVREHLHGRPHPHPTHGAKTAVKFHLENPFVGKKTLLRAGRVTGRSLSICALNMLLKLPGCVSASRGLMEIYVEPKLPCQSWMAEETAAWAEPALGRGVHKALRRGSEVPGWSVSTSPNPRMRIWSFSQHHDSSHHQTGCVNRCPRPPAQTHQ